VADLLATLIAESTAPLAQMEAEVRGQTPPEFRSPGWTPPEAMEAMTVVIRVCRRGHLVTPLTGYRHGPNFWECLPCKDIAARERS